MYLPVILQSNKTVVFYTIKMKRYPTVEYRLSMMVWVIVAHEVFAITSDTFLKSDTKQ